MSQTHLVRGLHWLIFIRTVPSIVPNGTFVVSCSSIMFSSITFLCSLRTPFVALLTYATAVATAPAASATPSLTVKTSVSNVNVDKLEDLKVIATIANTGGETLRLLNDPHGVLNPFPGDSFTITDPSGSRPPFSGAEVSYRVRLCDTPAC